jgi:hypothetical protein
MDGHFTFPSPRLRGEGGAALAAVGEGALRFPLPAPSPSPLPLKGARVFGVTVQRDQDCAEHAVEVRHHVGVRESDDAVASRFKCFRAGGVICLPVAVGVAVQFDHEALAAAGEVGNVRGEDHLPLELHAEAVRSEATPQAALWFGEVCPKFLGPVSCLDVPLQTAPSPRSAVQSRPLPLKGVRGSGRHGSSPIESVQTVNA